MNDSHLIIIKEETVIRKQECAECGEEVVSGWEVDDRAGDSTIFCKCCLPKCEVGRMLAVDKWFSRFTHMSLAQRSRLIIKEYSI